MTGPIEIVISLGDSVCDLPGCDLGECLRGAGCDGLRFIYEPEKRGDFLSEDAHSSERNMGRR